MIIRALDTEGDWTFGKGKNDYKSGNAAIGQNVETRLKSFLGDCFFALDAGIDWFNLLGSKNQVGLELAVRSVILNTALVTGIKSLSVSLDSRRRIAMTYVITTVYTELIPTATVTQTSTLLLTQDGDALATEDGDGLLGG